MEWMSVWMVLGAVFGLALLVLVVLGFVWLVRRLTNHTTSRSTALAEDELRRRYATGELDREEYLRRMADIRGP